MRSTARAAAACATERTAPLQAPRARLGASSTGSTSSSLQAVVAPNSPRSQSPGAASACCLRSSSDAVAFPKDQRPGEKAEAAPGDWERGELGATAAWSEEEVLPVLEAPRRARGAWSGFARSAAQAAAALAVLRIALSGWRAARGAAGGAGKEKGLVLP